MVQRCGGCGQEVTVAPWEANFFLPIILLGGMPIGCVQFLARPSAGGWGCSQGWPFFRS